MRKMTATIAGFLVSPLIPAAYFAISNSLVGSTDIAERVEMIPVVYVPSLLVTVIFGLPVLLIAIRFNLIRWWSVLPAGFAMGGLVAVILQSSNFDGKEVARTAMIGACETFCFWLIWKSGRNLATRE